MRYTVILERDPSGWVTAHVPTLRGCVSQGRTQRDALRNVKEAIALFIETLIEHGQPVPTETGPESSGALRQQKLSPARSLRSASLD